MSGFDPKSYYESWNVASETVRVAVTQPGLPHDQLDQQMNVAFGIATRLAATLAEGEDYRPLAFRGILLQAHETVVRKTIAGEARTEEDMVGLYSAVGRMAALLSEIPNPTNDDKTFMSAVAYAGLVNRARNPNRHSLPFLALIGVEQSTQPNTGLVQRSEDDQDNVDLLRVTGASNFTSGIIPGKDPLLHISLRQAWHKAGSPTLEDQRGEILRLIARESAGEVLTASDSKYLDTKTRQLMADIEEARGTSMRRTGGSGTAQPESAAKGASAAKTATRPVVPAVVFSDNDRQSAVVDAQEPTVPEDEPVAVGPSREERFESYRQSVEELKAILAIAKGKRSDAVWRRLAIELTKVMMYRPNPGSDDQRYDDYYHTTDIDGKLHLSVRLQDSALFRTLPLTVEAEDERLSMISTDYGLKVNVARIVGLNSFQKQAFNYGERGYDLDDDDAIDEHDMMDLIAQYIVREVQPESEVVLEGSISNKLPGTTRFPAANIANNPKLLPTFQLWVLRQALRGKKEQPLNWIARPLKQLVASKKRAS